VVPSSEDGPLSSSSSKAEECWESSDSIDMSRVQKNSVRRRDMEENRRAQCMKPI
jgi:hypothetical protein